MFDRFMESWGVALIALTGLLFEVMAFFAKSFSSLANTLIILGVLALWVYLVIWTTKQQGAEKRFGKQPSFYEVVSPLIVNGFDKNKPLGSFPADAKTFHLKKGRQIIITDQMSSWSSTGRGPIVSCVGGYLSNGTPIHFPVDRYYCVKRLNQVENVPEIIWAGGGSFVPHEKKGVSLLFKGIS